MPAVHGQVIEQRGLKLAFYPGLAGIDDFQYPARIQASLQPVIAITLPVQRRGSARDIEEIFCEALCIACRNRGAGWEGLSYHHVPSEQIVFSIACHAPPKPTPCIRSGSTGIMPVLTGIKTAS